MKNKLYTILAILFILTTSCEKYLEVEPTGSLLADQAFQTKTDVINGINGCYDALQFSGYYGRTFININDLAADNAYNGGTILEYGQVNNNNILEDNALIEAIWADIYTAINRVNIMLEILDDIELTEEEREEFASELRFLRALHYYNLSTSFGAVPIKKQATRDLSELNVALSTVEQVQDFVLEDLYFARGKLGFESSLKANDYAVETLLARVYLHQQEWDSVVNITSGIINSQVFTLEENYADLFTSEAGPESIFEVDFNAQDKNRLAEYFFPNNLQGRYEMAPEENLIEEYEATDDRKNVTLDLTGNTPWVRKYENLAEGSDNVYVFRFAEIYLMRAEANAQKGTGIINIKSDINRIRTRARLSGAPGSTKEDLLLVIEKERRLEFAFEGYRWRDLVRTGRAIEVLPNIESADQYYFPIPLSEKQTNTSIN